MPGPSTSNRERAADSRQTRLLVVLLAPVVLVVVALAQLYLAHTQDLSTWKGGGFGMFAAIDSPGDRFVQARLTTADGSEWIADIPALGQRSATARSALVRARTFPDARGLRLAAEVLHAATWVAGPEEPTPIAVPQPTLPAGVDVDAPPALDVVRVELSVLRRTFDPRSETVGSEELARWEAGQP